MGNILLQLKVDKHVSGQVQCVRELCVITEKQEWLHFYLTVNHSQYIHRESVAIWNLSTRYLNATH